MLASALHAAGRDPVHNRAGSNMAWGVATALIEGHGDEGLFEVDEAWLPQVVGELDPTLLVLGNLFRDQLDRYGEMEALADDWACAVAACEGGAAFALNADDPLIADLGRDRDLRRRAGVTFFGIEDPSQALPELQHAFDAKHCRRCGSPYAYERAFVGHLGHYRCPNCGADRPSPDVYATGIELHGIGGSSFTVHTPDGDIAVELPLPGLYNVYNALAAVAAAGRLGVPGDRIREGLHSVRAAFGRVETIPVGDRSLSILLIKNPAGANEVLRTLRLEADRGGEDLDVWAALNDRIADGRDVSWIWDADFELLAGSVRRVHCTGTRAAEMALRLKYAGWPPDRIVVAEGIGPALDRALEESGGRLFALPTYTALIELRTLLSRRGLATEFWR
jgi:UDP-N-acetylmuramyl tripeptide synthase